MLSGAPFTLTALKRLGGLHNWPEAVAVVLEASDQITRAGETLVTPDSDHIVFMADGRLTVLPGSPIPAHPVRQSAQLLSHLLRGIPAPAELRELVAENMQDPPACAWIEEFMTALAYFDRPRRPQIVNALAARAMLAQAGALATDGTAERPTPVQGMAAVKRERDHASDIKGTQPTPGVMARLYRRLFGRDDTS